MGSWDDAGQPCGSPAEVAAAYSEWTMAREMQADVGEGLAAAGSDTTATTTTTTTEVASSQPRSSRVRHTALVSRNRYFAAATAATYKLPAVLFAVALGEECFDAHHFKQANPDMAILPDRDLWKFWVFVGQFQPRGFRLRCGMDWSRFGLRSFSGGGDGAGGGSGGWGGRGVTGGSSSSSSSSSSRSGSSSSSAGAGTGKGAGGKA